MFYELLQLDMKTVIAVLFWGNLTSVIPIMLHRVFGKYRSDTLLAESFISAKFSQAAAWFMLFSHGIIPDAMSINIGYSLLFLGFYLESVALILIIGLRVKKSIVSATLVAFSYMLLFNLGILNKIMPPDFPTGDMISSLCIFSILLIPAARLINSGKASHFRRTVGMFYASFLLMLLPRALYPLFGGTSATAAFAAQMMTCLSLIFMLTFSLSAYLIFMKQGIDKSITKMASTDFLTGLPNRQSFLDAAGKSFEEHKIRGDSVAVLFMDIDYFKKVNDTRGHSFGDKVLNKFGAIIGNCFRNDDFACRYGGEEFVALLSKTDSAIAGKVTKRIMHGVAAAAFEDAPDFRFSISIGVMSGIPKDEDSLEKYIDNADSAMYAAKEAGRNRVVEFDILAKSDKAGQPDRPAEAV